MSRNEFVSYDECYFDPKDGWIVVIRRTHPKKEQIKYKINYLVPIDIKTRLASKGIDGGTLYVYYEGHVKKAKFKGSYEQPPDPDESILDAASLHLEVEIDGKVEMLDLEKDFEEDIEDFPEILQDVLDAIYETSDSD